MRYFNTKLTENLKLDMETESEYTVLMYLEVLCKLCFDNTVTKSNEDRVVVLIRVFCPTLQTQHRHKCFISDVTEAGKRCPYRLSS